MADQFTLGNVTFDKTEVPEDLKLKLTEKLAVMDFPGGVRTIQDYGAFLPDSISWTGHIFSDETPTKNAFDRVFQLGRLRGQQVKMTYGPISYECMLLEFEPGIKLEWWIPYTITIVPLEDKSQSGAQASAPLTQAAQLSQNTQKVDTALNAPASGAELPTTVTQPAATYKADLEQAMRSAGNNPANIPNSTLVSLQTQQNQIQNTLQPLMRSSDPSLASAATDLSGWLYAQGLGLQPAAPSTPNRLAVSRPNFFALSAQYYGNARHWRYISEANGYFNPQLPDGNYDLIIPPAPVSWSALSALYQ